MKFITFSHVKVLFFVSIYVIIKKKNRLTKSLTIINCDYTFTHLYNHMITEAILYPSRVLHKDVFLIAS